MNFNLYCRSNWNLLIEKQMHMNITKQSLLEKIHQAQIDINETTGALLTDKLILAYSKSVLERLDKELMSTGDTDVINYDALKKFLAENWDIIKKTGLSYTSIPNSDLTSVMCDVAELVANALNKEAEPVGSLQILMPDVVFESPGFGGYEALAPYTTDGIKDGVFQQILIEPKNFDLKKILSTHILDVTGKCLIPVRLIADEPDDDGKFTKPYYDIDFGFEHIKISQDELDRIFMHSSYTISFREAKERYDVATSASNDLYEQLSQLSKKLIFHSSHGGMGKDDAASFGAYVAIASFMDFYTTLPDEAKNKIPPTVKTQIERIQVARGDCVGLLGEGLRDSIKNEEIIRELRSVGQDDESKAAVIKIREAEFKQAKDSLLKAISTDYKGGFDRLPISVALLEKYNVPITIQSLQDIKSITDLSKEEIKNICSNQDVQQQIVDAIRSLEELVIFSIETPTEKLETILDKTATKIKAKLLKDASHLSGWLIALPEEKKEVVLKHVSAEILTLVGPRGRTFLHYAAQEPELLKITFKFSYKDNQSRLEAFIKKMDDFSLPPLAFAANNLECLEIALNSFGNDNQSKLVAVTTDFGERGSLIGLFAKDPERLRIILNSFGDDNQSKLEAVTKQIGWEGTSICEATLNPKCLEMILALFEGDNKEKLVHMISGSKPPLSFAAENNPDSLKIILDLFGDDKKAKFAAVTTPYLGGIPIELAARKNPECFIMMLDLIDDHKTKLEYVKANIVGETPIQLAVKKNKPECLKTMLDVFGDDNKAKFAAIQKTYFGHDSVLHLSANNPECLEIIFKSLPLADLKMLSTHQNFRVIKGPVDAFIQKQAQSVKQTVTSLRELKELEGDQNLQQQTVVPHNRRPNN